MPGRVLIVDDDPMLLSSLESSLGSRFEVETAKSGAEALRRIEEAESPYPVVVCDMRMPIMDGIQLIERARPLCDETRYLMLSGDHDLQTAVRAVNEGQVFRFLNKPCDPDKIAEAIDLAQEEYAAATAEQERLSKTFVGAMSILTDLIELLQPNLSSRALRTEQFVNELSQRCGMLPRWEYKIAAKLALIGTAIHPMKYGSTPTTAEARRELERACEAAANLVERIPRLEVIGQIIRQVASSEGEIPVLEPRGDGDVVRIGASLLRVAQLIEAMSQIGLDYEQAEADLAQLLPSLDPVLLSAARGAYPIEPNGEGVPIDVDDLAPGMVLQGNLVRPDGATLLRGGRRLTETQIRKLQADKRLSKDLPPVLIHAGSYDAARCTPAQGGS